MNRPSSPWAIVRQLWTRNFRANPFGTVAGSLLTVGLLAFMLFFGFFVVVALVVMGGLIVLSQALFAPARRGGPQVSERQGNPGEGFPKSTNNKEIEGEFEVLSDEKNKTSE